jgi:hypothetical protein
VSKSSKRLALQRVKEAREPGYFVQVPIVALASPQAAGLSPHACKLLLDLMSQYRPGRNGALCATWSAMARRGWRSKATLNKALTELRCGFLVMTKQGDYHRKASLYALSWMAIDPPPRGVEYNSGVEPTRRAAGTWRDGPTLEQRKTSRATRDRRPKTLTELVRRAAQFPADNYAGRTSDPVKSARLVHWA